MKKENFDACDAYVACLGMINMEKYGNVEPLASNIIVTDNIINYDVSYCNRTEKRQIFLNDDIKKEG